MADDGTSHPHTEKPVIRMRGPRTPPLCYRGRRDGSLTAPESLEIFVPPWYSGGFYHSYYFAWDEATFVRQEHATFFLTHGTYLWTTATPQERAAARHAALLETGDEADA